MPRFANDIYLSRVCRLFNVVREHQARERIMKLEQEATERIAIER